MILSIANINFSYNGLPVLKDLTFEVKAGEILAVLGVNGAGKSTLLKCINGILKPGKGTIFINDHDVSEMSRNETARYFGYVPQHQGMEGMIVFDAVLLGRKPRMKWGATGEDMKIVRNVLHDTGISHLAMRPLGTLSGGEKQKVFIARAIAQQPHVLLLDEPTNSLDVKNQLDVMGLLRNITKKMNLLTVTSLHDLNLALRFADRFLMLRGGLIHADIEKRGVTPRMIRDVYDVEVAMAEIAGYPVMVPVRERLPLSGEHT